MRHTHTLWSFLLLLFLSACGDNPSGEASGDNIPAAGVKDDYLTTGGDGTNWPGIGFNYQEQRYSPLKQIHDKNVDNLGIAWYADLPDPRGQEATPIIVDGILYVTSAWSKVFAYNAATGEELWSYNPEVPGDIAVNACCDVVNRGLALWRGKIFFGTLDGRLIALDAKTGARLWSTVTVDQSKPYTITGAPRVVKNLVLIGNGGAEFGVRGYVSAYNANDGSLAWRFYTTPNPEGKPDGAASDNIMMKSVNASWSDGEWKQSGGGGTVWDSIVYDPELDQVYFGVGNGNPWNHLARSGGEGDNLFLSSIVAVKPDTGEYLWHFQETPGESWDYTATQHIIQAEIDWPVNGPIHDNETTATNAKGPQTSAVTTQRRKVIFHAPKNGFFFIIDRTNGELLSAEPFVDNVNWATGYDLTTGRPIENPDARYYKTGETFIGIPGALGAHNWHPMSYNPATGLVYIPAQNVPQVYRNPLNKLDGERQPKGFNLGVSALASVLPDNKVIFQVARSLATGQLVAFDPKTGKAQWAVDHPTAWNGGTMTTAGNLVFQGTSLGKFRAYAADSGKQLLDMDLQTGIIAAPSTFLVDGEQYIAILTGKGGAFPLIAGAAGGESRNIPALPRLVVMKLGGETKLPPLPENSQVAWDPPAPSGTQGQITNGKMLYTRYCLVCHGDNVVGNSVTPDLRISAALHDKELWKSVVHKGILSDNGMVGFSSVINEEETDDIRHYVIDRSNWTKNNVADITEPGNK